MRRLDKFLLPLLTCLVVLGAILFPQQLSQWRDRAVWNGPHTEELKTENDLPTQPLSLAERMLLLARYSDDTDKYTEITVIFQEQESDDEAAALLRAELERLSRLGVLPTGPLMAELSGFHAQRCYLRSPEEIRGASFWTIDAYSKAEDLWLYLILDEETGYALQLDMVGPVLDDFDPKADRVGALFLEGLRLEYWLEGSEEYIARFALPETDCRCVVRKGWDYLRISPEQPAEPVTPIEAPVDGK